ncbi:hypothetical protein RFI_23024, partial [Reticulomyxa filosa]
MAQAPTTTENDATERFNKIKKMGFVSQANFFVNVWWSDLVKNDEHKNVIVLVLDKFYEQNIKFEAPPNCISSVQVCWLWNTLKKEKKFLPANVRTQYSFSTYCENWKITKSLGLHQKSSILWDGTYTKKKNFQNAELKIAEVTLLEAYIFLFALNVNEFMTKPSTPCEEAVRKAKTDLAALEARQKEILGKKEALEAKIEKNKSEHNLSPIQVAQTQQ